MLDLVEWVQCDKCRKWRMLNSSFDSRNIPEEWLCYMEPFNGKCEMLEMPEQKPSRGVITVGLKRSSDDPSIAAECKEGDSLAVEDGEKLSLIKLASLIEMSAKKGYKELNLQNKLLDLVEWVRCDKCRKWRMLNGSFDSRNIPEEWYMPCDDFIEFLQF